MVQIAPTFVRAGWIRPLRPLRGALRWERVGRVGSYIAES
jgi:hypothetical protein